LDNEEGYQVVVNTVLPCLHILLADLALEVRDAAAQSILLLASRLKKQDLDKVVLSPILQLVSQDRSTPVDDEQKASAIAVLNEISPILGDKLTKEKIVPELISLSQDPSFRVRKACAQNYGNVAKTVGTEFAVSKLLPAFIKLSNDSIWSVRKGCVESIVDVAEAVDKDVRRNTFISMITKFTGDMSRWVRNSAFRYLGPFIYVCEPDLISPQFLELFTGIPKLGSAVVDGEVNFFCAYNFPAVVARLGPSRWNELAPAYRSLCRDTKVCHFTLFTVVICLFSSRSEKLSLTPCMKLQQCLEQRLQKMILRMRSTSFLKIWMK
jgi:serine/threonine-protein phosphatase 4 regulatory subunit 1